MDKNEYLETLAISLVNGTIEAVEKSGFGPIEAYTVACQVFTKMFVTCIVEKHDDAAFKDFTEASRVEIRNLRLSAADVAGRA